MAYRHLMLSSAAKVFTRNNQLIISREGEKDAIIPIEDIATIMLESNRIDITSAALSRLSEAGAVVYVCDNRHLPCGAFTAYNQHSRKTMVLHRQINQSVSNKKRMWKRVVQYKILNQAECLTKYNGHDAELNLMAKKVKSGDTSNMEAIAAAKYFKELFGDDFCRQDDTLINAMLNYGYSILRGAMARHIVQYGLEPALGIQHHNQFNAFNLVDDLMEPYRPVVDNIVRDSFSILQGDTLTTEIKRCLYAVLQEEVLIENNELSVYNAIEQTAKSFAGCLMNEEDQILLPRLELEIEK